MASPVISLPKYTAEELAERRYNVESVLGTTLAEGVSPSPEVLVLFESYVRGEIEVDDVMAGVHAFHGK